MSENKNIIIQQNNRTDYDKYYSDNFDSNVKLSDSNATVWRSTLKDALPKINNRVIAVENNQWEIGDIRISTKEELGEKWLKADGSVFDIEQYPDLAKITKVADFPFGSQSIITGTVAGKALNLGSINETNLNQNNERANYVNGYYFRFKDYLSLNTLKYSLLIYYTKDKKTWTTTRISIDLTEFSESDSSGFIQGIGYVNRYWYLPLIFRTKTGFLYSTDLDFSNYSIVWIQDILSNISYFSDESFSQWGLGVYYYNKLYNLVVGTSYSTKKKVFVISAGDINFSVSLNHNAIYNGSYESGVTWSGQMRTYTFNNKLYTFWMKSSGSSKTTHYSGLTVSDFNGKNVTEIIEIDTQGGIGITQLNWVYKGQDKMYLNIAGESKSITLKFTTSNATGETVTLSNNLPTLILENGKFLYGVLKSGSNTWEVADNFEMENSKSYTATISGTINSKDNTVINIELPNGISCYTNSDSDSSRTYTLEYGGVLPKSNITSNSLTKLNAFIKAFD